MKLCPHCGANVEGLIHHCDCCGGLLDTTPHLFSWCSVDFAHDFGYNAGIIMRQIDTTEISPYEEFLSGIQFNFYSLPESVAQSENLRNRVYYSPSRKTAIVTVVVYFNDYVYADVDKKIYTAKDVRMDMVARAISSGLHNLQARLLKSKCSIEDIVTRADKICGKYFLDSKSTTTNDV